MSNAVKFSEVGNIILKAKVEPLPTPSSCPSPPSSKFLISISVSDEGIGIAESAKEKMFTPFTQADTSTTRKFVSRVLLRSLPVALPFFLPFFPRAHEINSFTGWLRSWPHCCQTTVRVNGRDHVLHKRRA